MGEYDWWFLDLVLVLLYAGSAAAALVAGIGGALRVLLAVPLVTVVPGYAVVSAVYPDSSDASKLAPFEVDADGSHQAIDGVERIALSVALSIALAPMVAAVVNFTPWGIAFLPMLVGLCLVVGVGVLVAFVRRLTVDTDRRAAPLPAAVAAVRAGLVAPARSSRRRNVSLDAPLNVLLIVSLLLVGVSAGYAATQSPSSDPFTEFYLVVDDGGSGGTPPSYATDLTRGDAQPYTLTIENREGERVEYTAVAVLQRVSVDGDSVTVEGQERFDSFEVTLDAGGNRTVTSEVSPTVSGDDLRVAFLLYRGDAPGTASTGTAYREVVLPVNVSDGGGSNAVGPAPLPVGV